MNVAGPRGEAEAVNVLPLFGNLEVPMIDPLEELLNEAYLPELEEVEKDKGLMLERQRELVHATHFPDQSIYILEKQLKSLRESLNRIKFYLGDVDDLLPR